MVMPICAQLLRSLLLSGPGVQVAMATSSWAHTHIRRLWGGRMLATVAEQG